MKLVSAPLRALCGKRMAPVWLVAAFVALVSFGLLYSRQSHLASTPHPALAVRISPLAHLSDNNRMQISLPSDRMRAALLEVRGCEFLRWNQLIHGLRLWGPQADGAGKWTGKRMLDVVCSAEQAQKVFGFAPHVLNRNGLHFGQMLDHGEKHLDETLSVLAEIGVNSDYPILLFGKTSTVVSEAVRAAASNFVLDQTLDFSAVVFAHYLPPQSTWTNKFGETVSFDDVCDRLCNQPSGQGNCYGCHVMYALAIILAADRQHGILSDVSRRKVRSKLLQSVAALRQSQRADGSWCPQWFVPTKAAPQADVAGSLSVTGHSLEWLAVAPQDIIDDSKMISRACEALMTLFLTVPPGSVRDSYNAYTHAANALKMWSPQAWIVATTER